MVHGLLDGVVVILLLVFNNKILPFIAFILCYLVPLIQVNLIHLVNLVLGSTA